MHELIVKDGLVFYVDPVRFDDTGTYLQSAYDPTTRIDNAVRVTVDELPPFFAPLKWSYEAGSLTPSEAYAEEITALVKEAKIAEIRAAFTTAEANGYVESSLGFRADATRRSIEDIDGLIDLVSSGALPAPVTFRDYDNAYHSLTLDQLNILRLEAKGRGPVLYARKWELEAAVEAAETMEAVQAVDAGAGWPGV